MPRDAERFGTAVRVLAVHGHIKERLLRAFEDHLKDLDDASLPGQAKAAFRDLRERLTAVAPLNGEGAICASIRKMSVSDAEDCACAIVDIYSELLSVDGRSHGATKKAKTKSAEVPAMLLKSV